MNALLILVAATTVGVEAGWEPLPEGGHRYTIQIEPELLRVLERGNDLVSEVPQQVQVRSFRITLGTGDLARIDGPLPSDVAPPPDQVAAPAGGAIDSGVPPEAPASFEEPAGGAQPLDAAARKPQQRPQPHSAEKPQLEASPGAAGSALPDEPWVFLLVAMALLAASVGANFYLGWVAWDARDRYRTTIARFRSAPSA